MTTVTVGIAVHAEAHHLAGTMEALAAAVGVAFEVVLLPDGPDGPTAEALATDPGLTGILQLGSDGSRGSPACFNRLAAATDTDVVVFLESGARPAPDALAQLVDALTDPIRPLTGLAGPSTNEAWNEQRALPHGLGTAAGLVAGADELRTRYGRTVRNLAPLYSLGDFCLAVRRDVVCAIGAADEGFGLGPCWEMEYGARAARAGFDGVWVSAAYVHRAPFTARRRLEETRRFEASRRRYQDRLCGLRLNGTRVAYSPHCEGDVCPHFAPPERIALRLPLPRQGGGSEAPMAEDPAPVARPARLAAAAAAPRRSAPAAPVVSCVMATANRPEWVAQSISYFLGQDFEARELVIVDDGDDGLPIALGPLLADPRITYVRVPTRTSIGQKRNLGCQRARGDLIAHWDDDDYFGPARLRTQVEPILDGSADITAFRDAVWFDVDRWRFRRPDQALHKALFVEDVHGGTLLYRRSLWERGPRFPDLSLAEDAFFLRHAIRGRARLAALPAAGHYVYVRHGANSWQLAGRYADHAGWEELPEPPGLSLDRAFYASRSAAAPPRAVTKPAVSCVMPTADRRPFVPQAIACFLAQSYTAAELVVVDDGHDPVADVIPADPRIRYVRLDRRQVLGAKRNLCVEAAAGDVIVHWDDDDWSHPERLAVQVAALADEGVDACGLDCMLWWDPSVPAAWRYTCPPTRRAWVAGNTLAYTRAAWRRSPFPGQAAGEDTAFLWSHASLRIRPLLDERLVVGTIHGSNTSPKNPTGPSWQPVPVDDVLRLRSGR